LLINARNTSAILKALSHESRLMVLCLLTEGEKCVSELECILNIPQAAASQHLARLRSDRLVNSRRDGRTVFYSLTEDVAPVVETLYRLFCVSEQSPPAHLALQSIDSRTGSVQQENSAERESPKL
jgi:DNA-binding transcriptional ArsR family regulator